MGSGVRRAVSRMVCGRGVGGWADVLLNRWSLPGEEGIFSSLASW